MNLAASQGVLMQVRQAISFLVQVDAVSGDRYLW